MPSWGTLASLGYTHPPELLISFGPLASLTPGPHQIHSAWGILWSPPTMTPLKYRRHFLSVTPTLKPQQLLWPGFGQPY